MKVKLFAFLLAFLMLLSMASCNASNTGTDESTVGNTDELPTDDTSSTEEAGKEGTTEEETTTPVWGDGYLEVDHPTYNDDEFKLLSRPEQKYIDALVMLELDSAPTSMERAVYTRMVDIEKEYRIKFAVEPASDYHADLLQRASTYAKTGKDAVDLVNGHTQYVPWTLAINGCLYEWHDLEKINLDAPYWSQSAREEFSTPGGKLFFLTGDANHLSVGHSIAMFFNRTLLEKVDGLESPYAVVKRDEWYLDTFQEYVLTVDNNLDGDGNGALGKDSFGYVTPFTIGPRCVVLCAGYPVLMRDENRTNGYRYTVLKESVITAAGDYVDFMLNSGSAYYSKDKVDLITDAFIGNTIAFFDYFVDTASTFTKSEVDFGVLPWPMYNSESGGYTALVDSSIGAFCVLINSTNENAERISYVLESLSYYGYLDIMPLYYETILSYQYLKNEEDVEMLRLIHDSLAFDMATLYNPGDIGNVVSWIIDNGGSSSLSNRINTIQPSVDYELKKWAALDE